MSVHHPETSAAPRNPPSPDSATSSALSSAIARAKAAEAALAVAEEALTLAANRLHRRAVDFDAGSREFIETQEWAEDARTALAKIAALKGGAE